MVLRITVSQDSSTGAEFLFGKKHRYLLPFPINDTTLLKEEFKNKSTSDYRIYSPNYGWSHGIWGSEHDIFFSNDKGWRISKEQFIRREAAKDSVRYLFIGNSFTHGDPIEIENTWPYLISNKRRASFGNIAVGGYGIDQAILRFKDETVVADTVFFGVVSGDLERALQPVYNLYLGNNKTKPYFIFSDSTAFVANQPALKTFEYEFQKRNKSAEIFQHITGYTSYFYGETWWSSIMLLRAVVSTWHRNKYSNKSFCYLRPESSDFKYCLNIFSQFKEICEEKGVFGVVVLLDNGLSFNDKISLEIENPWQYLQEELDQMGIISINFHKKMFDMYQENQSNIIHPEEGLHYSIKGHKIVTQELQAFLEKS